MANTIPCPNPICTHEFGQAELQAASAVQCPKCGFRMQGQGAAPVKQPSAAKPAAPAKPIPVPLKPAAPAAVAKPAAPVAKSSPAPMLAKPLAAPVAGMVAAKVLMATPVKADPTPQPAPVVSAPETAANVAGPIGPVSSEGSVADGMLFSSGTASGPLVRTGEPKRRRDWLRVVIALFVVGFAVCLVVIAVIFLAKFSEVVRDVSSPDGVVYNGTIRNEKKVQEKIYKLVLPKQDWSVDNEILNRLGAHFAWKHNEREFWFAISVKDYDMLKPRDAEMLRLAVEKLENYYGDALELDAKALPAKIGDLPAQKIRFKGQVKAANWLGECYMFFQNGIAYWLFMASPDWETVEYFAAELPEKNFFVVSERRGWREQTPPMETFRSESGALTMSAPKGVWEKHNAKNEDEKGDLFLFGRYLREKDNRKNATMLIITMDKKPDLKDAIKAAREYLGNKIKGDNTNYKLVHATDVAEGQSDAGTVEDVGNRRGRIMDLKLQFNDEPKRYYLLAVVNEPDIGYAIVCDCTWESRQIWRQDFVDLLRTFRIRKGD